MSIEVTEIPPSPPPGAATGVPGRRGVVQLDGELVQRTGAPRGENGHAVPVRTVVLEPGPVDLAGLAGGGEGWLGLLITDGVLLVEMEAGRARVGWITGPDDLLRPWDLDDSSLTSGASWRALGSARVALLDEGFARRVESFPALTHTLLDRSARTTRWLLAKSLVLSSPVIEERLLLLFALLAERWGRVTPEGVRIELSLTHELLATLCGARRPSVTMALRSLTRRQLIERGSESRWVLRRELGMDESPRPSCWEKYAAALGLT